MPTTPTEDDDAALYRLIGAQVLAHRERARMTQAALAEHLGVTRTSITNLEQGQQRLPLSKLIQLAAILEIEDYRTLLPAPTDLTRPSRSHTATPPHRDTRFLAATLELLAAMHRAPTQRISTHAETLATTTVVVTDTNPLHPAKTLFSIYIEQRPMRPLEVHAVVNRMTEVGASRGVLISADALPPDAAAAAAQRGLTVLDPKTIATLAKQFGTAHPTKAPRTPTR